MDYRKYRSVFHNFTLQPSNALSSFSMSDDNRVLSDQHSNTIYPQLQLDTPTYKPEINRAGTDKKTYYGQVAVMVPVIGQGNWANEDEALDSLEPLMDELISWLDYHRKLDFGRITEIGSVYPIKRYEHANLFGWGVQITVEAKENYCYDASNYVRIIHLYPEFIIGENTLQIEVESNNYSTNWDEESRLKSSLIDLKDQINADTLSTDISAIIFNETLVLVHNTPLEEINYDAILSGHNWHITSI